MRIGELTRENVGAYQMLFRGQGTEAEISDILTANRGKFEARFTPVQLRYATPDWTDVPTKSNLGISDEEFEESIRELARKNYKSGTRISESKEYAKMMRQYISVASPDRKAIFDDSMKKTGGKMNAALSFFDASGKLSMTYSVKTFRYYAEYTPEEDARVTKFSITYQDEIDKLRKGSTMTSTTSSTSNNSFDAKA
jgi:hypothetical protein